MIHVALPLHDKKGTYSKYVGVAMLSIFENTKENVTVHLLHDETLNNENREKLIQIAETYNQKLNFYLLPYEKAFIEMNIDKTKFSIGTMFRLYIGNLLPTDIEKIIYLDADIVVNLDIKELWQEDIGESEIAAVIDMHIVEGIGSSYLCEVGKVSRHDCFNAGVLLINLLKLRQQHKNLLHECLEVLKKYPQMWAVDQDALNYIYFNQWYKLPVKYNSLILLERKNNNKIEKKIYHYAARTLGMCNTDVYDQLFWKYFLKSPWSTVAYWLTLCESLDQRANVMTRILRLVEHKKKIFWGPCGRLHNKIIDLFVLHKERDYYIDNNQSKYGQLIDGISVFSHQQLVKEDKEQIAIIVMTLKYEEVKKQLVNLGYVENVHFFDGRKLVILSTVD